MISQFCNKTQNNKEYSAIIIFTLLFPFLGLIYALFHWRESWSKNVFWMVCVYMGAIMIFMTGDSLEHTGRDAARYVIWLRQMEQSNLSLFDIWGMYLKNDRTMDLYQPTSMWIISRFTINGHFLFAFYAFVFGFFYSRNIWYILNRLPKILSPYSIIPIILLFLLCPIWNINGARMWTAAHIFIYGFMPYLLEGKKTQLIWVILTPLFHFSFLYLIVLSLLCVIINIENKLINLTTLRIAGVLFVITIFVSSLDLSFVASFLHNISPNGFENRIDGYTNIEYANYLTSTIKKNNWYVSASNNVASWGLGISMLMLIPRSNNNNEIKEFYPLLLFSLLISSYANITSLIPSGSRFLVVANIFSLSLLLLSLSKINPLKTYYMKFVIIALSLPLIVNFRKGFDYYPMTLLFGNYFTFPLFEYNNSIMDTIKQLL